MRDPISNNVSPMSPRSEAHDAVGLLSYGAALGLVTFVGSVPVLTRVNDAGATVTETLEHLLAQPTRVRAKVAVDDVAAFVAYVQRFQNPGTIARQIIFAEVTETGGTFTAVLDYHQLTTGDTPSGIYPAWGEHRCIYTCKQTLEWVRWMGRNGKPMSQVEFAEFLENNGLDVNPNNNPGMPTMADMVQIARSLDATIEGSFNSAVRLNNGSVQFKFTETVTASANTTAGTVEVPERFVIGIAPFVGFDGHEIFARLKYRLSSGKLSMWYELERPHKIVEAAAKDVIERIIAGTGIMPLRGRVEAMGLKA